MNLTIRLHLFPKLKPYDAIFPLFMTSSLIKRKDNFLLPSTVATVVTAHCLKTAALLHIYVIGVKVTRVFIDDVFSTRGVE